MLNKARIALAAALIVGGASAVLAGEGSPDLSYPAGYDNTGLAPNRTAPLPWQGARGDALEAYAFDNSGRAPQQFDLGFTAAERALFDRQTGSPDHN